MEARLAARMGKRVRKSAGRRRSRPKQPDTEQFIKIGGAFLGGGGGGKDEEEEGKEEKRTERVKE